MARNIVKDYIDYDRKFLKEYIDIITEAKLNSKICDMIIDTYIGVRYYDMYEHVKKYPIDNIEYYVINNYKKNSKKAKDKNILLIVDALLVLRYVFLYEKYRNINSASKNLVEYEEKLSKKFDNTKIIISGLIKKIKDNTKKKEKFLNNLLSNDFSVGKYDTNIKHVFTLSFDNSVKIPDLFSDIAIDRVYNTGIVYEDRMTVFYLLITREILVDMDKYNYENKYLLDFPNSLIDKRNKLLALLKIIDTDYLKERMILKVLYSDYLKNKEGYDKLIHDGYSLAVKLDDNFIDNIVLLKIFSYILIEKDKYVKELDEFNNVILL